MFCRGKEVLDTEVVLIREFRSAGGFVVELPGGSVLDDSHRDPIDVALEEAHEEIGFDPGEQRRMGCFFFVYLFILWFLSSRKRADFQLG